MTTDFEFSSEEIKIINQGFISFISSKPRHFSSDYATEDFLQDCWVSFVSCNTFDPDKGELFSYAFSVALSTYKTLLRKAFCQKRMVSENHVRWLEDYLNHLLSTSNSELKFMIAMDQIPRIRLASGNETTFRDLAELVFNGYNNEEILRLVNGPNNGKKISRTYLYRHLSALKKMVA